MPFLYGGEDRPPLGATHRGVHRLDQMIGDTSKCRNHHGHAVSTLGIFDNGHNATNRVGIGH